MLCLNKTGSRLAEHINGICAVLHLCINVWKDVDVCHLQRKRHIAIRIHTPLLIAIILDLSLMRCCSKTKKMGLNNRDVTGPGDPTFSSRK